MTWLVSVWPVYMVNSICNGRDSSRLEQCSMEMTQAGRCLQPGHSQSWLTLSGVEWGIYMPPIDNFYTSFEENSRDYLLAITACSPSWVCLWCMGQKAAPRVGARNHPLLHPSHSVWSRHGAAPVHNPSRMPVRAPRAECRMPRPGPGGQHRLLTPPGH